MANVRLGFARQSDYRESLIESILSKRYLIYGAEVCQVRGHVESFESWAGAVATHRFGLFACRTCFQRFGQTEVEAVLRGRSNAFCEVCLDPGAPPVDRCRRFLCEGCRTAISRHDDADQLREVLHRLARRRYLERRPTQTLEVLDLNSEVAVLSEREEDRRNRARRGRLERQARRSLAARHSRGDVT